MTRIIEARPLDMTAPRNRADRMPDPNRVALPEGVAETIGMPDDLTREEASALRAAWRGNGACTVGNLSGLIAGPTGWTSGASNQARTTLARLCARGLMSAHPKRDFVFLLTTTGKGLAALLVQQARASAPQPDGEK